MTESEFRTFLAVAATVCAIIAALNLVRYKKRGISALLLASACLATGAAIWLYRLQQSMTVVGVASGIAFVFLVTDLVVRSAGQRPLP